MGKRGTVTLAELLAVVALLLAVGSILALPRAEAYDCAES
jgi:hypothetical protein